VESCVHRTSPTSIVNDRPVPSPKTTLAINNLHFPNLLPGAQDARISLDRPAFPRIPSMRKQMGAIHEYNTDKRESKVSHKSHACVYKDGPDINTKTFLNTYRAPLSQSAYSRTDVGACATGGTKWTALLEPDDDATALEPAMLATALCGASISAYSIGD
jgi:hypothetical protein